MSKKHVIIYALIIVLLASSALAQDAFEIDDTPAQATITNTQNAQTHTHHTLTDQDWLSFGVFAGDSYMVETFNLSGPADPVINITNSTGAFLGTDDNSGQEVFAANITFVAQETGIHLAQIYDNQIGAPFGPGGQYLVRVIPLNGTVRPMLGITAGDYVNRSVLLTGNLLNSTGGAEAPANGLNIVSPNVILDCDGFTIRGSGAGVGVNVTNVNNVTIRNCNFENFATDVLFFSSSISTAFNSTSSDNLDVTSFNGANNRVLENGLTDLILQDSRPFNIINQTVRTYFYITSRPCVENQFGKVCFEADVAESGTDFSSDLVLSNRFAGTDVGFPYATNFTFFGTTPLIQSAELDGLACGANCTNYLQTNSTFFFRTPGMGNYTVVEDRLLRSVTLTENLRNSTGGTGFTGNAVNIGGHGITLDCNNFNITG
ncbi:MAG: hypothetical protein ACE5FT_02060, partial [Candidatus Nanoarchaeia archaeon]